MNTATPSDPYCHRPVQRSTAHARGRLTLALCLVTLALLNACTGGSKDDREQTLATFRSFLKHADYLQDFDIDLAIRIQRNTLKYLEYEPDDSLRSLALIRLGRSYCIKDELERSDSCYTAAENIVNRFPMLHAELLINRGINQNRRGKSDVALALYDQADALIQKVSTPNEILLWRIEINRAVFYQDKAKYDSAMICLQRALRIAEKKKDKKMTAPVFMNMGNILFSMFDYEKADSFFRLAEGVYDVLGYVGKDIEAKTNQIGVLVELGRYDEALDLSLKAEHLADSIGNRKILSVIYHNRGYLYYEQQDYSRCVQLAQQSLELKKQLNDTAGMISSLSMSAAARIEMGQYAEAIREDLIALQMAEENHIRKSVYEIYNDISEASYRSKDFLTACKYLKKQIALKDSIFTKEKYAVIEELQVQYETEKRELEKKNIQAKLEKVQIILFLLSVILVGIVIFLIQAHIARKRRLRQEISIALKDEKEELLTEQALAPQCSNVEAEQEELGLSEEKINELLRALRHCMEEKQMYKEKDLRIETVANEIGTNRTYLSGLLNNRVDKTFTEYINFYRIKEAKRLLRETDDIVKKIALEVGFGSYQTFNYVFGKAVRLTPGEYRKAMRKTDKDKS